MNGVMLQGFEWYLPADGAHFERLKERLAKLKELGFTAIWLPPVCKATGQNDVGYGIYDLFDLGEFDQKGSVATKYGTKDQLKALIEEAHKLGLNIYADVVLNHKAGADETQLFKAVKVDPNNRNQEISEGHDIEGWTKFTFPGRKGKYSEFEWGFQHFNGVDFDNKSGENGIFRILGDGKGWSWSVDDEKGNFDYLMFADIDHNNEDVRNELFYWVKWFIEELNLDGFRLDAVKHIDANFIDDMKKYILSDIKEDFYTVGEYWVNDLGSLGEYMYDTSHNIDLFDVPLHYNLYQASKQGRDYDLRKLFDNTIVQKDTAIAVTFSDNHDSQLGQSLESWVEDWFKEISYSLILLRKDGYPCVFYGDYYGIESGAKYGGMNERLERLLELRRDYAYGDQDDYFDDPNTIGFVRRGDEDHPGRMAVVMTNGDFSDLRMFVGEDQAGKVYVDYLGNNDSEITIGDDGFGTFNVSPGSVSVYVEKR